MTRKYHIALKSRGRGKKDRKKYGHVTGGGRIRCKKHQRKDQDPKRLKKTPRYMLERLARRL